MIRALDVESILQVPVEEVGMSELIVDHAAGIKVEPKGPANCLGLRAGVWKKPRTSKEHDRGSNDQLPVMVYSEI